MRRSDSIQFGCACVVIEPGDTLDEVIEFAEEIDAIYWDEDDRDYVVDFQIDDRRVGPELYTPKALASSFRSIDAKSKQEAR